MYMYNSHFAEAVPLGKVNWRCTPPLEVCAHLQWRCVPPVHLQYAHLFIHWNGGAVEVRTSYGPPQWWVEVQWRC